MEHKAPVQLLAPRANGAAHPSSPHAPHRWCAPYPPLADWRPCAEWPPALEMLWQACRSARETLATLEAEASEHSFDRRLWRLVDAAHAVWLDVEAYARPLLEEAERRGRDA